MRTTPFVRPRVQTARFLAAAMLCTTSLFAVTGCSDSSTGKSTPVDPGAKLGLKPGQLSNLKSVETELSASKVTAGLPVTVKCVGQPGDLVIPQPTFRVDPIKGWESALAQLTVKTAGSYNVACFLPNASNTTDPTPAQLLVTVGAAATVSAAVEPAQIASGAIAKVTCTGKDAYGNDAATAEGASWTVSAAPPEVATVAGLDLTGNKVGKAAIKCALAGSPEAASTPANLTVIVGAAKITIASVTPATIEAGAGQATVACAATDAAGNPVEVSAGQFTLDVPAGLKLAGLALSGTKSGKYDVKCNLTGVTTENKAATLEVKPSTPTSMTLVAKPALAVYKPEDAIKLTGLGIDQYGNEVPDMPLALAAIDPPDEVTVNANGKSYTFQHDGIFTFTAASTEHPALSGSLKLKVDSTGPLVLVTDPKRGETRNGDGKVVVKGTCLDELSALKLFTINKQAVKVAADGSFTFEINSEPGMNAIVWEAKDEWDNTSSGVQAYYYSTEWFPQDNAKPESSFVKSGIGVWMSQSTLDAGPPHDHVKPKDLASVAEIIIQGIDISQLLGSQAFPIDQGLVFKGGILIEKVLMGDKTKNGGYPEVSLTVIKGGIHLVAKVYNFETDLLIEGKTGGIVPIKQQVIVTADWISIDMDVYISIDPATGKAKGEAKNTKLKMQNLKTKLGGLGGTLFNWLIDLVAGFVQGPLTGLLEQVLQTQIQQTIGDGLGAALGALAINQELPLKPFIGTGPEVKLKLNSKLGLLEFIAQGTQQGGILVGLDAAVTAEKKVDHPGLGSIGRAACLVPGTKDKFNPSLKHALEIGLADDFANELLYSVWNGGLMNLTIGKESLGSVDLTQYGVSDLKVSTDFLLPPILNTCIDKAGLLKLQIGDLLIHAEMTFGGTPVDVYIYATIQATAELKATENPKTGQKELGFALKGIDFVELEVWKINAEAKDLKGLFVTMIKSVMIPKLVESLGSGLGSFPLPEFDLSAFSPSIPKGSAIALEIQQIDNLKGYTYLRGKVK